MLRLLVMIGLLVVFPVLAGAEELPPIPAPMPLSAAEEHAIEKNQPKPSVVPIKPVPPETLKRLESQYNESCGAGLTKTSRWQHHVFANQHDCEKAKAEVLNAPPGVGFDCIKCGDGICKESEDSCNCPADCKK